MKTKILSLAMVLVILAGSLTFVSANTANTPPPYGTVSGNVWTENFTYFPPHFSYSITPVPNYVDTTFGEYGESAPRFKLALRSVLSVSGVGFVIHRITAWDSSAMGEHGLSDSPVYRGASGASYTFAESGLYSIYLGNATTLQVEVLAGSPAPSPVPSPAPSQTPGGASDWARPSVTQGVNLGLVPALLQANYQQNLTRAEFAALAIALYEEELGPITGDLPSFNDTNDINVRKAAKVGIASGVGGGNFNPNGPLTREMAAVMLAQLSDAIGQPFPSQASSFADSGSVANWARDAVGRVQAAGIMSGVGSNRFGPDGPYTREQGVITMLKSYEYARAIWPGRYICELGRGLNNPYIDIWTHDFDFVPGGGDGPFLGFFLVAGDSAIFIDEVDGTPFLFKLDGSKLIYDSDYNVGPVTKGDEFILVTRPPGQDPDNVSAARRRTPVTPGGGRSPDKPWLDIDIPTMERTWSKFVIYGPTPGSPGDRIAERPPGGGGGGDGGGDGNGGGTVEPSPSPSPDPDISPPPGSVTDKVVEPLPPRKSPPQGRPLVAGELELINTILVNENITFTGTRTADFILSYDRAKTFDFIFARVNIPPRREATEFALGHFLSSVWQGDVTDATLAILGNGNLQLTAGEGPVRSYTTIFPGNNEFTTNVSAASINETFTPMEYGLDILSNLNAVSGGIYGSVETGGQVVIDGYDLRLALRFDYATGKIHAKGFGFIVTMNRATISYSNFEFESDQSYLQYLP
ncbi:MAG: S-layer homology domain-containing protein [Oscillospiraceae bacterium]|nr:S-layer homology domain-containing protein [Oscillospiraceae bacterium]